MVVDDDVKQLIRMSRCVANLLPNVTVRVCCGANEVLTYLAKSAASFILTDDVMPNMDGLALARAISQRWPRVPVLLLTEAVTPDLCDAAQTAGCVGVVTKSEFLTWAHAVLPSSLTQAL